MHVYCNFLLLTSRKNCSDPPTFFGLATPLSVTLEICNEELEILRQTNMATCKFGNFEPDFVDNNIITKVKYSIFQTHVHCLIPTKHSTVDMDIGQCRVRW